MRLFHRPFVICSILAPIPFSENGFDGGRRPLKSPVWKVLLLLAGIALIHRLALVAWTSTIASDSAEYLWMAEDLSRGQAPLASSGIHPLYPASIAAAARLLKDPVRAGYWV